MKRLTIFTPTYNRAYILPSLYESLKRQTNKEFCWVIVDDGSKDETKQIVGEWRNEKVVEIAYIKQENAGKMQAHNVGVLNCKTDYFMCVDSDDFITDDAVDIIINNLARVDSDNSLAGIVAYKGKSDSEPIGNEFPAGVKHSPLGELYKRGFKGDTSLIFKTEILKQYLFPKINGEKFMPEDYVYSQIDQIYKLLVLPQILIICDYLGDGYTKNMLKVLLGSPQSIMKYYCLKLKFECSIKERFMLSIRYIGIGKLAKQKRLFKNTPAKMSYVLMFPFGILYFIRKKYTLKKLG